MEEVIEALRERAEVVPVPLDLPDMDDIVTAEEQILIGLPYEFKQFMLEVSDLVIGGLEPVTVADPCSHTYLAEVAAQAWNDGLPREYIPLCQRGADYYCVDQEGGVTLWLAASSEMAEQQWDSVWHWARDVWLDS